MIDCHLDSLLQGGRIGRETARRLGNFLAHRCYFLHERCQPLVGRLDFIEDCSCQLLREVPFVPHSKEMGEEVLGCGNQGEQQVTFLSEALGGNATAVEAQRHYMPDKHQEGNLIAGVAGKDQEAFRVAGQRFGLPVQVVGSFACSAFENFGHAAPTLKTTELRSTAG
jgi:hypothetical protein